MPPSHADLTQLCFLAETLAAVDDPTEVLNYALGLETPKATIHKYLYAIRAALACCGNNVYEAAACLILDPQPIAHTVGGTLEWATQYDDRVFHAAVRQTLSALACTPRDLSLHCDASASTIALWADGLATRPPTGRAVIYEQLARRLHSS